MRKIYDYIIIGAGSAGCVLAHKLSENPAHRVLLLEAGGSDRSFWIQTPLGYAKTFSNPKVNWRFSAKDQGLNGRECYFPRGKVIGGSGSINAMAYLRGLPHDFDDWASAGAHGWDWQSVHASYQSLETHIKRTPCSSKKSAQKDALYVSDLSAQMHPFCQSFQQATADMGWDWRENIVSNPDGLGYVRSNVYKGRRWSSADAFLRPVRRRRNLDIITHAHVQNVLLEGARATGVSYRVNGEIRQSLAHKEVILSAGAIGSPQLLQLSGIGPEHLLKSHGITVQHALPHVGQGLQDHLGLCHYFTSTEPTLNSVLGNPFGQIKAGIQYILTRKGPLSIPVNQTTGFVRSSPELDAPDVQIYCNPMAYTMDEAGNPIMPPTPGFLICAQPSRPTSRGSVNIASANPADAPIIDPNSLSTREDQNLAIRASKIIQKIAQTPSVRAVTADVSAPDINQIFDDAALLENFRNRAGSVFHASCTCRMGHDAQDSVLDERLRVHGIAGLRVIDASAFPNVTSGNTNAPTMMLAARGADMILQDAKTTSPAGVSR